MPKELEIDHKTSTVLGFSAAGWGALQKTLKKENVRCYTTTDNILPPDKSIYWRHHPQNILEQKALAKQKEPESVRAALESLAGVFMRIEENQTRENLIRSLYEIMREPFDLEIVSNVNTAPEPNEALLIVLINMITSGADESCIGKNGELIDITGHSLASCLRNSPDLLKHSLCGNDRNLLNDMKMWCEHADLTATPYVTQHGLAQSKGAIIDTLQRNIELFKQGKPLIPIRIVISSDEIKGSAKKFSPEWDLATSKRKIVYTNAEIRMIYKLSEELGDPLISKILRETVFFLHQTSSGFKQILAPWQEDKAEKDWAMRLRSKDRPAYKDREPVAIPQWIQELTVLSHEASLARLEKTNEFKKTMKNMREGEMGCSEDSDPTNRHN